MEDILVYFVCGFMACLIDGCIGMAYGVSLTTVLSALGVPLLNASATIHFCELFTSFASGVSHLTQGNVDFELLKKLIVPGAFGAFLGAIMLVLTKNFDLRPYVSVYLLFLGLIILVKSFRVKVMDKDNGTLSPLGFVGGFFDATGGGGWGPIVTSTLIAQGRTPAKVIGTVNLAEFVVTVVQAIVFIYAVSVVSWKMILGFVTGGCIAAPLAAIFVKSVNARTLMLLVAIAVIVINTYVLVSIFV